MEARKYADAFSIHPTFSLVRENRDEYDVEAKRTREEKTDALRAENEKLAAQREARERAKEVEREKTHGPRVRFEMIDGLRPARRRSRDLPRPPRGRHRPSHRRVLPRGLRRSRPLPGARALERDHVRGEAPRPLAALGAEPHRRRTRAARAAEDRRGLREGGDLVVEGARDREGRRLLDRGTVAGVREDPHARRGREGGRAVQEGRAAPRGPQRAAGGPLRRPPAGQRAPPRAVPPRPAEARGRRRPGRHRRGVRGRRPRVLPPEARRRKPVVGLALSRRPRPAPGREQGDDPVRGRPDRPRRGQGRGDLLRRGRPIGGRDPARPSRPADLGRSPQSHPGARRLAMPRLREPLPAPRPPHRVPVRARVERLGEPDDALRQVPHPRPRALPDDHRTGARQPRVPEPEGRAPGRPGARPRGGRSRPRSRSSRRLLPRHLRPPRGVARPGHRIPGLQPRNTRSRLPFQWRTPDRTGSRVTST